MKIPSYDDYRSYGHDPITALILSIPTGLFLLPFCVIGFLFGWFFL